MKLKKSQMVRAVVIDALERTVYETLVPKDGAGDEIKKSLRCEWFTVVTAPDRKQHLYVDDEGLINGTKYGFFYEGFYPTPLYGNGVLLGSKPNGDSGDALSDIEEVRKSVVWLEVRTVE